MNHRSDRPGRHRLTGRRAPVPRVFRHAGGGHRATAAAVDWSMAGVWAVVFGAVLAGAYALAHLV